MKRNAWLLLPVGLLVGCAGLSVPDMLARLDKLQLECHGVVAKLNGKGITRWTGADCDREAANARERLIELLDKARAELAKAGV